MSSTPKESSFGYFGEQSKELRKYYDLALDEIKTTRKPGPAYTAFIDKYQAITKIAHDSKNMAEQVKPLEHHSILYNYLNSLVAMKDLLYTSQLIKVTISDLWSSDVEIKPKITATIYPDGASEEVRQCIDEHVQTALIIKRCVLHRWINSYGNDTDSDDSDDSDDGDVSVGKTDHNMKYATTVIAEYTEMRATEFACRYFVGLEINNGPLTLSLDDDYPKFFRYYFQKYARQTWKQSIVETDEKTDENKARVVFAREIAKQEKAQAIRQLAAGLPAD